MYLVNFIQVIYGCMTMNSIYNTWLLGCLLFGYCYLGTAQNLIPNPSFEDYDHCPEQLGNFYSDVTLWNTPTLGSTDYFNGCSTIMGTPKNFNGEQEAYFGKGYAGLYLYAPGDYREYLQVELKESLEEGKEYEISFFVSLAERSDFAVKDFGILFSSGPIDVETRRTLSKMHLYRITENSYHFLEINYSEYYKDKKDWVKVSTSFTAKGTERYICIGNFRNNAKTRNLMTKRNAKQGAYYYIDKLNLFTPPTGDAPEALAVDIPLDEPQVFENIHFDFDTSRLLDPAKKDLAGLYDFLKRNESYFLKISGHTDNLGSDTYNQKLSDKRCKAVADYLISLGLSGKRIDWKGFGGLHPVAENGTEEGRQKNRRVEFVISENQP